MVFTFLENALNLCIFTHALVPHQNSRQKFLKVCFSQAKRDGENYDLLYQNSTRKYGDNLEHQVICTLYDFVIFLNVMALQFCKQYLSNSVVLSLLSLLCNHGNLTLKLHQKKIAALNECSDQYSALIKIHVVTGNEKLI